MYQSAETLGELGSSLSKYSNTKNLKNWTVSLNLNESSLQLPADLMGFEGLQHFISLLVKISDVLPKTTDCVLPMVWVDQRWRHRTGIGA